MTSISHLDSDRAGNSGSLTALPQALEKFIMFELGGYVLCVNASAVAEVVPPLSVTQLPEGPEWLLGLAAHRGEIVAVIDPGTVVSDVSPDPAGAKAKLIIFRPQPEGSQFALPVGAIRELFAADPANVDAPLPGASFQTEIIRDGVPIKLLDHQAMFASFYKDQAPA